MWRSISFRLDNGDPSALIDDEIAFDAVPITVEEEPGVLATIQSMFEDFGHNP